MAAHLTRSAIYPMEWMGLLMIYCGMAVKMEAVILIGKGRWNLTCFVY